MNICQFTVSDLPPRKQTSNLSITIFGYFIDDQIQLSLRLHELLPPDRPALYVAKYLLEHPMVIVGKVAVERNMDLVQELQDGVRPLRVHVAWLKTDEKEPLGVDLDQEAFDNLFETLA